eukprot:m.88828 g.88828  ORF g.88828 m.88828 type:complete len:58 (+) comp8816_c5_seq1:3554-3727(+)
MDGYTIVDQRINKNQPTKLQPNIQPTYTQQHTLPTVMFACLWFSVREIEIFQSALFA